MIRNIFIFLATFAVGAVVALAARSAWFAPQAEAPTQPDAGNYPQMVSNALVPAGPRAKAGAPVAAPGTEAKATKAGGAPPAPRPNHPSASTTSGDSKLPVNTVCAICAMDVDPKLPTAKYKGKTIGFGCTLCRPKFEAEPDRYGPHYLRNAVIEP